MTITRNNRQYQIEIEHIDCFNSKITVYEIFEDGKFKFIGKAITNDPAHALDEIIK